MSKIGRKPINIKNLEVNVADNQVHYKGKKASGVYVLPLELQAEVVGEHIALSVAKKTPEINRIWGLHRALLANKMQGADVGFERYLQIVGLGFKAVMSGKNATFSLGYSEKIPFELPDDVTLEIDGKTGQNLIIKGIDRERVGLISSQIRALRPPEPYKGTGIKFKDEVILRKAGKTKNT